MKKTCDVLLKEYQEKISGGKPKKVRFIGVEGYDVYNPSIPFEYDGKSYIVGRVEKRDSEESEAVFFEESGENEYVVSKHIKRYNLQDPFVCYICGEWILGGTEICRIPNESEKICWRTTFYHGKDINNLELLTRGPIGMKDIRMIELDDNSIGVFTRPQGEIGGRGKIGFFKIDSLKELTNDRIEKAVILDQFIDEEWGGVNQAIILENGHIGVIGHIAKYSDDGARHYYSMAFTLNPMDGSYTPMKIIAVRTNFLKGAAKREDLKDVLFSAGIVTKNGKTFLYTGVSDAEVQMIEIDYPFET